MMLTTFPVYEDLAGAAGLSALRLARCPLCHLVHGARELDVELLLVDRLAEGAHGILQPLLRLVPNAVHVTQVWITNTHTRTH